MTERIRLPWRRSSSPSFEFEHGGLRYRAQYSEHQGQIVEVFLNAGKEGTAAHIMGMECAVILSIALQHGTPLETLTAALPKLADGNPAGPVGMALKIASEP